MHPYAAKVWLIEAMGDAWTAHGLAGMLPGWDLPSAASNRSSVCAFSSVKAQPIAKLAIAAITCGHRSTIREWSTKA